VCQSHRRRGSVIYFSQIYKRSFLTSFSFRFGHHAHPQSNAACVDPTAAVAALFIPLRFTSDQTQQLPSSVYTTYFYFLGYTSLVYCKRKKNFFLLCFWPPRHAACATPGRLLKLDHFLNWTRDQAYQVHKYQVHKEKEEEHRQCKHYRTQVYIPGIQITVGLARTIYIQYIYGIFGRKTTKYTVIYGVYIQFWPALNNRYIVYTYQVNNISRCAESYTLQWP